MDIFICNKCFAPTHRGKAPFCLTQCGHIYCHGCMPQGVQKQCPQCQQIDVYSIELQEPTLARVENFFIPLNESLESLRKTWAFQNTQMRIMLERFFEIDKKYETLKSCYFNATRSIKLMKEKYTKLKMEYAEEKKKLKSYEMQSRTLHCLSDTSTPVNSDIQKNIKMRNSSHSYFSYMTNTTPQSSNVLREKNLLNGFRIPHPQSGKPFGFRGTSDRNSTFIYKS